MPALSPTMEEGGLSSWEKSVGNRIESGEVIAQIETDKAIVDFECADEGYLAKILVDAGTTGLKVGTPIAILCEEEKDLLAFEQYPTDASSQSRTETSTPTIPDDKDFEILKSEGSPNEVDSDTADLIMEKLVEENEKKPIAMENYPDFHHIKMPALSPTMEKGIIVRWMKSNGDAVAAGDVIAEVETDKAIVDFECAEEGYIAKILVEAGSEPVEIGMPVAIFVENKKDVAAFKDFDDTEKKVTKEPVSAPKIEEIKPSAPTAIKSKDSSNSRVIATPHARKLAASRGIDLGAVSGTGPGGRILVSDILEFKQDTIAPVTSENDETSSDKFQPIPVTQIRKIIAKRLTESKQKIPHYYLTSSICADEMIKVRKALNSTLEAEGGTTKISVNDFIIKAAAAALRAVPTVNSSWAGDMIRRYKAVDINVAISTETGLVTPFVTDADSKGLRQISNDVKMLANKAREGKLSLSEYQGGTFTVSNLGMMGVEQFCAIINPPQAAILAVGCASSTLRPDGNGGFHTSTMFKVTLSCDHRVVDGAVGAQWLQAFKKHIEDPLSLLL